MEKITNGKHDYKTRTLKSTDGRIITYFNGVLHSWDGPSIKYPKSEKKKDEYYLYGFQLTKDEWVEARKDRNGVPPDKNPQVKSRF
jgi:hypothetical protein